MKITTISATPIAYHNNYRNVRSQKVASFQQPLINNAVTAPIYSNTKTNALPRSVIFMGYPVHIVDGGNHATNMQHFAKAISRNIDVTMHKVEVNRKDPIIKQMKSVEYELKRLNETHSLWGEYVAIPALASVPILNLQDQYNRVMGEDKKFTPENLKSNKKNLLAFLKKIYENPTQYRQYIDYMDPAKQGLEYTYGVIQEINKLKGKSAQVYIPSGHPHCETLKWMASQRGLKPELYHYIATGEDTNHRVQDMCEEIKRNNWYDFNLLSLSDANVVGVKEAHGAQDYMFAAYDSCVTDGMRGVYNFSPVRQNGKLIGYSYTDTTTNEYPYDEFPANDEIANLVKFVGKKEVSVIATQGEIENLKKAKTTNSRTLHCADKLYPIQDIFTQNEIQAQKMYLRGKYVDKTLKTFFDVNSDKEIIFPNCDCEGSGKPSVLSMWGSCFAVFNAIARDIKLVSTHTNWVTSIDKHLDEIKGLKKRALEYQQQGRFQQAEETLNYAIDTDKAFSIEHSYHQDFEPHYLLGNLHYSVQNYKHASNCYNNAIDILAKFIYETKKTDLKIIQQRYEAYVSSKQNSEKYNQEIRAYSNKSAIGKFFSSIPTKPSNYNNYISNRKDNILYQNVISMSDMFSKLAKICQQKGETYPAKVCQAMAYDITQFNNRGNKVLELRSQGVQYLGDLYPEIKEER